MAEGTLWNAGELDEMDALVIMQVHNRDVSATGGLKEKYTDYTTPFDRSNYAAHSITSSNATKASVTP